MQTLNLDVTIGYNFDAFDVNVVKTALTRSIGAKFADVLDEISTAFSEYISPKDGEYFYITFPCHFIADIRT